MSGTITCTCGKRYTLRPEMAGKRVRCRACGATMIAPASEEVSGGGEVGLGGVLSELAAEQSRARRFCTACSNPLPADAGPRCPSCGATLLPQPPAAPAPRKVKRVSPPLEQPFGVPRRPPRYTASFGNRGWPVVALVMLGGWIGFFAAVKGGAVPDFMYHTACLVFICLVGLLCLLQAFLESAVTGLLSLVIPLYLDYFIFFKQDAVTLKIAPAATYLSLAFSFALRS